MEKNISLHRYKGWVLKSKQKNGRLGRRKVLMLLCSKYTLPSLARVYILCSLKLFELIERSPLLLLRWLRSFTRLICDLNFNHVSCGMCKKMHASLFICKGLVQHLLPLLFPPSSFFPYYHRCWMLNRPRFFYCSIQKVIVIHKLMDRYISNGRSLWMKFDFSFLFSHL